MTDAAPVRHWVFLQDACAQFEGLFLVASGLLALVGGRILFAASYLLVVH